MSDDPYLKNLDTNNIIGILNVITTALNGVHAELRKRAEAGDQIAVNVCKNLS